MKRVFLSLLLAFVTSLCFLSPIHAQDASWVDTGYDAAMKAAANGDVNSAAYISNADNSTKLNLVRQVLGAVEGLTVMRGDMDEPYAKKMNDQSAVSSLASYISDMYTTPPASTYAFVQDMGQTLGFIPKQAYAQGIGFSGLSPLLPVWKAFRNITYVVLAIIMVAIGFMVMFRKKIDPKTVITVQNALPKIVVTLILITFSYAIVGIMIDVMYILIGLIGSLFQSTGLLPELNINNVIGGTLWSSVFKNIPESQLFFRIVFGISDISQISGLNWLSGGGSTVAAIIGLSVQSVAIGLGGGLLFMAPILVALIFSIAMLLLFLRLFVFFLSTYIKIILALLFSPFQLLLEAVPGSKSFDTWFRGLIANLLVFPAATVLFLISAVFMKLSDTGGAIWYPPYAGLFKNATSITTLVSIGVLFMIPNVGKMINEALKPKPGMTGGFGEMGGMLTAPTQIGMQVFQMASSKKQMSDMSANITKAMGGNPGGKSGHN